jgi:hypothetical protein
MSCLWSIRKVSINVGSIILSPKVDGGLHMRGMKSSTIPSTSLTMLVVPVCPLKNDCNR